ncbi:NADH-quinone oxidoreductase subunit L [Candidatus Nitrospira nitrificans]|uniref:NADH:ubiquinone oxidoreductase, membrane subunit L n=1 Tax=Candidatus Nitrospira nitrificans TaxID=1742973 RepID=A0A0S4LCN1_9BACT|nr:NADH-quinone oxidoreductase subunit L [Candidatus Nitrospira nitrificans]CUS33686.1 NADH:ubiquinone oxidoreductase, membrane subunit L [Candidatus Nitrospira nitrificans]
MSDLTDLLIKLIPVFPLLAVLVNGLLGSRYSQDLAHRLAWGSVGLSFLCTVGVFTDIMRTGSSHEVIVYQWIFGGDLAINLAYLVDPLTCAWLLVVTGVGFLIHVYSVGYMHGEAGFTRFFTYMNLFMVSMLLLVMGNNYVVLFIGWEGVGLCSYLLIGYYYDKVSAAKAASKAFVVNRIGDAGFLVAIFLVFINFKTLDYTKVFAQVGQLSPDMATAIALCLLVGAIGKSAQLPLHTWLPDAMEGPTPVSALIHAATMVTAGVYMIVRNHAIFDLSPFAMSMVAFVGGGTALFAATIGLVQTDIKRVLAYSTVSQLGYMFLGCGIGAYTASVFHVMTHAFFKALLFLSAGSVIHALSGEQDIRKMGGLSNRIPWTHRLFLIGTIAIAGLPPLAGFWSKDEIMAHAFIHHHYLLYCMAAVGALMTSFYMFRLTYLTFYGASRMDAHTAEHVHESPMVMVAPLLVLAFLSLVGGLILGFPPEHGWLHGFLAPVVGVGAEPEAGAGMMILLMSIAIIIALLGWGLAHFLYAVSPATSEGWAERFSGAYRILLNKYYVDELYDLIFVEPLKRLGAILDWFDRTVIDGIVRAVGRMTDWGAFGSTWIEKYIVYAGLNVIGYGNHLAAREGRKMQSGMVHHYAAIIVAGLFLLVLVVQLFVQM